MNSWTKLKPTNLPIAGLALALAFVSGCERALVFADRTGVNLAVRSDMAEGSPLEVNAGLKRRVVGFVPAKGESEDGRPSGEAVNMVSRFDLKRTKGAEGPFSDKVQIRTSFASGGAAVEAASKPKAVEALTKAPGFVLSDDPQVRSAAQKLYDFTGQSPDHARAYLAVAESEKLDVAKEGDPNTRAVNTITNPANADGNRRIVDILKL
ncbi:MULTISPECIES: hypothetical protein [unclassified Roseovarius]|uniref:hypothetical protein n=1 Tax=unclassified Roseovarius TaxID=2614913 RepID=UPI00273D08AD|nr:MULTISPECIES: hypothetical protein [unclassified Roseovarius]